MTHTFTNPSVFPYHCTLHGTAGGVGMSSTVTVRASSANQANLYLPFADGP
jgi:hypothetical protein